MPKMTNLRVPTADLEALRDALATGEGIEEAAAVVGRCEDMAVTIFAGPFDDGMVFRIPTGKNPVNFMWPTVNDDGDIVIPVQLHWLKGIPITEARGSVADARELAERLLSLTDAPE